MGLGPAAAGAVSCLAPPLMIIVVIMKASLGAGGRSSNSSPNRPRCSFIDQDYRLDSSRTFSSNFFFPSCLLYKKKLLSVSNNLIGGANEPVGYLSVGLGQDTVRKVWTDVRDPSCTLINMDPE